MQFPGLLKGTMAVFAVVYFGLGPVTCTTAPGQNTSVTINDLHVTTPAAGWVEPQNAYQEFSDTGIYNLLYDSIYLMNSVKKGFHTTYENAAETTTVVVFIIDYGTAANAAAVCDTLIRSRADNNHPVTLTGFSTSAEGSQSYNGLVVYACFDRFYFQLTFNNYPDPSKAISDAEIFLAKYKSIAEKRQ